jgi:hypothetical protein
LIDAPLIPRSIDGSDYFRGPSNRVACHREWMHFGIFADSLDLLVNFNLAEELPGRPPRARLALLARYGDGWDGDVDEFDADAVAVRGGAIEARFGECSLTFVDGSYRLAARLRRRAISLALTLRPLTFPSLANNVALGDGPPISWLVVPRLAASGEVLLGTRRLLLRDAPAYHDHNWGSFGAEVSWLWGCALPDRSSNPWSLVFVRLGDRGHTRVHMQALLLWRRARQSRVFRAEELRVSQAGWLKPPRILKVPRVMALLAPSMACEVPRSITVDAQADGDHLRCAFVPSSLAQLIVPRDRDLGVTTINEVGCRLEAQGRVRGERFEWSGCGMFELLHG